MAEDKTIESIPWRYCELRAETCDRKISDLDKLLVQRVDSVKTAVDMGFTSMEKALILASRQQEKHDAGVNEFQKRMDKLEATFATKSEVAKDLKASNRVLLIGAVLIVVLTIVLNYLKL